MHQNKVIGIYCYSIVNNRKQTAFTDTRSCKLSAFFNLKFIWRDFRDKKG